MLDRASFYSNGNFSGTGVSPIPRCGVSTVDRVERRRCAQGRACITGHAVLSVALAPPDTNRTSLEAAP